MKEYMLLILDYMLWGFHSFRWKAYTKLIQDLTRIVMYD
jgi:hypothetical protein